MHQHTEPQLPAIQQGHRQCGCHRVKAPGDQDEGTDNDAPVNRHSKPCLCITAFAEFLDFLVAELVF